MSAAKRANRVALVAALALVACVGARAETAVPAQGSSASAAAPMLDLSSGAIAEDLRAFIRREMPWDATSAVIEVVAPTKDIRVPDGEVELKWRSDPNYEYLGPGSFRGEICVNGEVVRTVYTKATVAAYDAVVVATQPLGRGDLIGPHNARLEKRELSTLDSGACFSLDEVKGRIARTAIQPGQVLSTQRLDQPRLVKRNQLVAVETRVGGLTIRGQAKATGDAAVGEVVTCTSLTSKEQFSGVVRADGVVEVR